MKKIRTFLEMIFQQGEMSIYRRILRTALWGSCVTFVVMGGIFLASIFILQSELQQHSKAFSQKIGDYTEESVQQEVKDGLTETTVLRARLVRRLLDGCSLSVELLAAKMGDILQHKEEYMPKHLPVANEVEVADYVPYVYYTPGLLRQGLSPEMRREIAAVSAIEDDFRRVSHQYYGSILAASRHGYLIRMDMLAGDGKGGLLCYEPLRSSYDYQGKDWYQAVIKADKLLFTEPYIASYGKPCISICAPYHDADGIAGVVVADIDTDYLCQRMKSDEVEGADFSFVMDRKGAVIISPRQEGTFAATGMSRNLRQNEDEALAATAERMVAGEQGIALVKADGAEYYLAYAPLPDLGWSIGTVIDKAEITAKGDAVEAYVGAGLKQYNMDLRTYFLLIVLGTVPFFILTLYLILKRNVQMAKGFAVPINSLTDGVREIAAGNLQRKLYLKTGDELETLAESFNHMTGELAASMERLAQTTAQKERIETELSVATRIKAKGAVECIDFVFRFVIVTLKVIVRAIPLVVFLSMASLLASTGIDSLLTFSGLFGGLVIGVGVVWLVGALTILLFGHISPLSMTRKIIGLSPLVFTVSSSHARLPFVLNFCADKLGIDAKLAAFSIPVGVQLNKAGNCIFFSLVTLMLMQVYAIDMSSSLFLTLWVSVCIMAIAKPPIPCGGIICIAYLFTVVGVPAEAISVILCVEPIAAMFNGVCNESANIATTFILAKDNNMLEERKYFA